MALSGTEGDELQGRLPGVLQKQASKSMDFHRIFHSKFCDFHRNARGIHMVLHMNIGGQAMLVPANPEPRDGFLVPCSEF